MTEIVLDSSAFLAAINREPGGQAVLTLKGKRLMSSVNVAEVYERLSHKGYNNDIIASVLERASITVVDFDTKQAIISSDIRSVTRKQGLSLADRACFALAITRKARLCTADKAWRDVELDVDLNVIR